ncbi:MAG: hypothetical protein K0R26_1202 [Bacteroidota bacterium]|nr:hypothetical protein [Bacteroidota bacterium]
MNCIKLHSRVSFSYLLLIWVLAKTHNPLFGQTKDTSAHILNEIVILENKEAFIKDSKKIIKMDSLSIAHHQTSSLTDLLSNLSTVHVKSYGPGNIASTSIRGGNSNQTAILWNGFNINNPALGMYDLSLVPVQFFDDFTLNYGGGSALWGSGTVGGSIHLNNNPSFNKGFQSKVMMSTGSFGSYKMNTGMLWSRKRFVSNTKVFYQSSENNFTYKDTLDKENQDKTMQNASYLMQGLMQELSFKVNQYHKINLRGWYNYAFRNLPTYFFTNNTRNQKDNNLKISADWSYSRYRIKSITRMAFFDDKNTYNDSLRNTHSKNQTNTFITENENTLQFKNHSINFGVNYTSYLLRSQPDANKAIAKMNELNKIAFFSSYKLTAFHSKLTYNASIRKELTSLTEIPFTGNMGLHYKIFPHLAAKLNGATSYRQPTLYDLYWQPGGNEKLKSEEANELEGAFEFKKSINNVWVHFEATYFDRHTKNWITWLPSDKGYVSPVNIAEVYSRGTETKSEICYVHKNLYIKLAINTAYVLSTYEKNNQENDNSLGRQLIFTPRYTGQAHLLISYKKTSFLFNQNYTGYRFTASDNTSWLMPYYFSNLKCSYAYTIGNSTLNIFGSINNVFNSNYVVMPGSPMPFRNYEIGLTMNYHKPNKSETQKP